MDRDGFDDAATEESLKSNISEEKRSANQFSSRWAFWLSAIGCSVGFGNVWRFPNLVYKYGGGAFFIPYIIGIFLVTLPIAILEFGAGQLSQGGNVAAFRSIHRKVASVGWGFWGAFNVMNYYPVLLSWSLIYFTNSFKKQLPWMATQEDISTCQAIILQTNCVAPCVWNASSLNCIADPTAQAIKFFESSLTASPSFAEGITQFNGYLFLCETLTWITIFAGTVGGARILGYLNYFITTAPAVFLLLLVGVGCSLKGAGAGLKQYIGKFDMKSLKHSLVWTEATSQSLYSLGACQGTTTAYAAHNKADQNFVQDAYIVEFGDSLFAFIAGFAVFAVLGYMSTANGIPIEQLPLSGSGLAFQAFPVGLGAGLKYPWSNMFSVMFFLTLWLLGMSTCVGLVEGICLVWSDSRFVKRSTKIKRWHLYLGCCCILLLIATIYSTNMGIHILACTDFYLTSLGYTCVCIGESFSAGWMSSLDLWVQRSGKVSVYTHMSTYLLGTFIAAILGFTPPKNVGQLLGPLSGAVIIISGFVAALLLSKEYSPSGVKYTLLDRVYYLTFYNVNQLRKAMNTAGCQNTIWRVPRVWLFLIKYFIPLIMILMVSSVITDKAVMFSLPAPEENEGIVTDLLYPWWVFIFGFTGTGIVIAGMIIFFIFPNLMTWLVPEDPWEFPYHDDEIEERKDKINKQVENLRKTAGSPTSSGSNSSAEESTVSLSPSSVRPLVV